MLFFSDVEVSFNISCEKPFDMMPNAGQLLPHSRIAINMDFKPEVFIYILNLSGSCKSKMCSSISLYFLIYSTSVFACLIIEFHHRG